MTNTSAELYQPHPGPQDHLRSSSNNDNAPIFKSGPLFLSSKGIGWTSWKKRWFILTHTSLVFFRSDPMAAQKGQGVNLTLGGIDLNNSGSVVVKADKKLLTVQFPDARDGRTFTLKAETTEDLFEWKTSLEKALAQAPSVANVMDQNGDLESDQTDSPDISLYQSKDTDQIKYKVIGQPVLLALEEIDGTPSFLEKALRFIEEHGAKVEGILRQSAYVDDVENRVREYEQGKVEFSEEEDAHVIADCVKHILRALPSSPVPASCCKALLEACRTHQVGRASAMRSAICDTFPEPNRRLLERILLMMRNVASRKSENRMSSSAVAACMAPLLLRPLLAGDCEIENDFDVGGDGSFQLLQAAAAANHAQAIVITLLEDYDRIFGPEDSVPVGLDMYMDSEDSESESEEVTDDDFSYDDDYDDEQDESSLVSDIDADDDLVSETNSETEECTADDDENDNKEKKNLSAESIDYLNEDESEITRLEAAKAELQNQIAEEVNVNVRMQSDMETRKKALQDRRLALEQVVARLQEELLKEKSSRATLEPGIEFPIGTWYHLNDTDEESKVDTEELVKIEVELTNLEKKVDELGERLNVQLERDNGSLQISNQERNLKNNPDTEVAAPSESDMSIRKQNINFGEAGNENERRRESTPLPNKYPPSAKKSGIRVEGGNSATSTLSKLTARLNFLKERHTQISHELQNVDKGQEQSNSAQNQRKGKGSEPLRPLPIPNKPRGFEFHLPLLSPNKPRGYEFHLPLLSPRGYDFFMPLLSPNRSRGQDSHSPNNSEKGRGRSQSPQTPDKDPNKEG